MNRTKASREQALESFHGRKVEDCGDLVRPYHGLRHFVLHAIGDKSGQADQFRAVPQGGL
jgi:hypothetical protein